jgi:FixJ family two-component response regulator
MTIAIGLITINACDGFPVSAVLSRCGFEVRTAASANAYVENSALSGALCVVIDLPGDCGLKALETLRARNLRAPAILVVDADCDLPPARLAQVSALDVLRRPVNTSELLGWIECVCTATMVLERRRAA